jgi:predicted nuclease with TOPRIM domain
VTLKQDDDQVIQLFDWTGTAVQRADALAQEISGLRTKYKSAEDTISQLNSRLEELVQAKNEHDDQLIAKFAKLLNEKKLKIRNQQRLLATADVNSAKRKMLPQGSIP